MSLTRRLLLFWISFWLAGNGALAGVMPISAIFQSAPQAIEHRSACHEEGDISSLKQALVAAETHAQHISGSEQAPVPDKQCNHCRICQMSASILPALTLPTVSALPVRDFAPATAATSPSFIPEPPQHIPLPVRTL